MTTLIHPCSAPISQEFGDDFAWQGYSQFYRQHYGLTGHNGIDYAAQPGMEVRAAADGTVLYAGWGDNWDSTVGGGAYVVILDHGDILTAYLHLTAYSNRQLAGARVKQGDVIATTGNTGVGTGPHLHFQVMPKPFNRNRNWGCVDPRRYMQTVTAASSGATITPIEDDDMPFTDWPKKDQDAMVKAIHAYNRKGEKVDASHMLAYIYNTIKRLEHYAKASTPAKIWRHPIVSRNKGSEGKTYGADTFLSVNNANGHATVSQLTEVLDTLVTLTNSETTPAQEIVNQIKAQLSGLSFTLASQDEAEATEVAKAEATATIEEAK